MSKRRLTCVLTSIQLTNWVDSILALYFATPAGKVIFFLRQKLYFCLQSVSHWWHAVLSLGGGWGGGWGSGVEWRWVEMCLFYCGTFDNSGLYSPPVFPPVIIHYIIHDKLCYLSWDIKICWSHFPKEKRTLNKMRLKLRKPLRLMIQGLPELSHSTSDTTVKTCWSGKYLQ